MSKVLVIAFVSMFTTVAAHADPEQDRSPALAEALALAGTAAGPLLFAEGVHVDGPGHDPRPLFVASGVAAALGPSLGEWYAGRTWSRGLTWRLVGGATFALGAGMFVHGFANNDSSAEIGLGLAAVGGAGVIGGTALDLWDAPHDAYAHAHARLAVAPIVARDRSGLAVVGTF